jgi:hypothetical protein
MMGQPQPIQGGKLPPRKMPADAIVLILLGNIVYWVPAAANLITAIYEGRFSLQVVLVPVSTLGVLGCVGLMGAMPKWHIVWAVFVLLLSLLAIAVDGYLLITLPLGIWVAPFLIALGLILVGAVLAIVWKPPSKDASHMVTAATQP